jgi:DNA-binding SARP family transcriptional activator/tetratricopeptide (TPR) repeat protein
VARLRIELVGGVRTRTHDGTELPVSARKCLALLGCLALRPGVPLARDFVASLLWDAADPELARASLRQALATLRRVLPRDTLLADSRTVWLDQKLVTSDVHELREALREAASGALVGALGRCDGELFGDIEVNSLAFDHWARDQRQQFRRQVVDGLERAAAQCAAAGDSIGLLDVLERLVRIEPSNERAHRGLMSVLASLGRHTDALRQYRDCQQALRRDLDVATEPATDALLRDIMRQRRSESANEPGAAAAEPTRDAPIGPLAAPTLREAVILCVRGVPSGPRHQDPEVTRQHWSTLERQVRAVVEGLGGRVDRVSQGEVMAVFGLAALVGNEAERALRAASELAGPAAAHQSTDTACTAACGIAAGQVLPASSDDPFPLSGRAIGDASTLARLARASSVLVSREIVDRLESRGTFQRLDDTVDVHGQSAHELVGLTTASANRPTRPFIGRRAELALLTTLLEQVRRTGSARTIAIRGEPGIGKSSLVQAFAGVASELGVATHTLQVLDFGQSATDRPVPALALRLLGIDPHSSPVDRATAVEHAVSRGMVVVDDGVVACDLVGAAVTGDAAARLAAMDAASRQDGRAKVLRQLLANASERPLLLVVEDVHWAAGNEMAQLSELVASLAARPLMTVLTSRTAGDVIAPGPRTRGWASPVTTLDLAPLADDEARELATTYEGLSRDIVERCLGTALGHPLFLEQLLRAAMAGQTAMPGSVRGLVLARIERLSPSLQHVLQAAAVLGLRFHPDALRHVLAEPNFAADPLEDAGLIAVEADECRFAHALIRDAIHDSLLGSTRRTLHRRAASWYESRDSGLCADHLAAAEDDGAAAAYLRAALESKRAFRLDRALAYAERALETAREPGDRCDALAARGDIQLAQGRTSDACDSFRRSVELAGTGAARSRCWLGVAMSLRIMDRHDEALQAISRAEAEVDPSDFKRLAELWTLRGNVHFPRGELDLCMDAHGRALDFAQRAESVEHVARALGGLGDALYQRGRMRSALDHYRQCVELTEQHGLAGLRLAYLPMVAVTEIYMGKFALALEMCASAAAAAFEVGDRRARLLTLNVQASIESSRGRHAESLAATEVSHALALELGSRRFEAEALVLRGLAQLGLQQHDVALRTLEAAAGLARGACPTYCAPWALASLAFAVTDQTRAQALLTEGETLLARDCVSHNYFEFYNLGIEVALRLGELERAARYASALDAYTRDEPLPWAAAIVDRGRALVAAARNEPSVEAMLQASLRSTQAMDWVSLQPALLAAIEARGPTSIALPP